MSRPRSDYGPEVEASLLWVTDHFGLLARVHDLYAPVPQQVWAQPQYEDDDRMLWRILPGQGYWSGSLLLPGEVELIRQGRVLIELREIGRAECPAPENAAAPVVEAGAETFN